MPSNEPFADRTEAGVFLAEKLTHYAGAPATLILALVRGGVAVGQAMTDRLQLPLFPYVVRKIGHPGHREFGVGAIAEGGSITWDADTRKMYGLTSEDLQPIVDEEQRELRRRVQAYAVTTRPPLRGKTVILTDDGAATGGTMLAAIEDVRKANADKVVVALPVAPPDTALRLRERADETIILSTPSTFNAVGQWYLSFPQLSDGDVLTMLRSHAGTQAGG